MLMIRLEYNDISHHQKLFFLKKLLLQRNNIGIWSDMYQDQVYDLPSEMGIISHTLQDIFGSTVLAADPNINVDCSMYEIYNEEVYDLMSARENHKIREIVRGQFDVPDLKKKRAKTAVEAIELLRKGLSIRKVGATDTNNESSRSHAIFTITIQKVSKTFDKINFVDLVGSECAKKTNARNP